MGPKIAAGSEAREAHVGSCRKWCLAIIRERKELISTSLILRKTLTFKPLEKRASNSKNNYRTSFHRLPEMR